MCHASDALPPAVADPQPIVDARDLILEAADGNRLSAYEAHPEKPSTTAVVILPDVRGLHDFYRELVRQFASAGHHAIAFDYFGRTDAGTDARPDDFPYRDYFGALTPEGVDADCAAAVAHIREARELTTVITVGFCFGGSSSWRQSARNADVSGCVGFYGMPSRAADVVSEMRHPLLILAPEADMTPIADVRAFAKTLDDAGVKNRLVTYPGAPHSYFDRHFGEWQDACVDSWKQIFTFIEELEKDAVPAR